MVRIALRLWESLGATRERLEPKMRLIHPTRLLLLEHTAWLLIARVIRGWLRLIVWEKCWIRPIARC